MKKDIREIIYKLYEESLQESFEEEFRAEEVVIGGVYFGSLDNKRVMFVIIDKIGDKYFEALKISQYWELGTASDILYEDKILGKLIIQTGLNFYLTNDEIKKFKKIDTIDIDDVEKIKEYRELSTEEKLKSNVKRGLFYLYENKWVEKFKEKELEVIKPYHLRIFDILDEDEEF